MKSSDVSLKKLTNFTECEDAIESIENDFRNYYGGISHWTSGKETVLTKTAKNKIKSIEKKMDSLFSPSDRNFRM